MSDQGRAYHHGNLRTALLEVDVDGLIRQTTRTMLDGMRVRRRRSA